MEYISRGYQGTVYVMDSDHGRVVVKKPQGKGLPGWLSRATLRREYRAYQRLGGVDGVPRCFGLRDDGSLVLEYLAGEVYRDDAAALVDRARFFAEFLALIHALHAAGVAHADLKRRGNLLISPAGRPLVIDFGTAAVLGPDAGWFARRWFRQACRMDFNAWVKLKYRRRYDQIQPADRAVYQPTWIEGGARVVRRVWRKLSGRKYRKALRRRQW